MRGAFDKNLPRHPVFYVWVPLFALVVLLSLYLNRISPNAPDAAHTLLQQSCHKDTGLCTSYYETPLQFTIYVIALFSACIAFIIFWLSLVIARIRRMSGK